MTDRTRDLFIDALRGGAVVVVVVGHWLAASVVEDAGRLTGLNALSEVPGSHLATWVLQVMPVLFFVGGFANARSLARHDGYLSFVRTRMVRLLTPTLVFLGVWLAVGIAAEGLDLPAVVVAIADLASLPFWFLGVYVIVITLAPWLWRLHRRFGWRVIAVFVVGAAAVDWIVHGIGVEEVGVLNFAFVWLLPHQLGYFHSDGRLDRIVGWRAAALAGSGLAVLVVTTSLLGYPVSLIAVPGADRFNTNPPSFALLGVVLWLVGLALVARPTITSWAERRRRWVRRLNAVPLTLYLWHVGAAAIAAVLIDRLGFPRPEIGTTQWWWLRLPWLLSIVPVMGVLVWAFHRFEIHPQPQASVVPDGPVRHLAIGLGVVSLALGLLGFGVTGFDNPTTEFGGKVLVFEMNPLQNILHVAIGCGLMWQAVRWRAVALGVGAIVFAYAAVGAAGWSDGIAVLAMNPATAIFHVVLAVLTVLLLVPAVWSSR